MFAAFLQRVSNYVLHVVLAILNKKTETISINELFKYLSSNRFICDDRVNQILPFLMLKRLGERIAGHKKRRKIDALIKLSAISSRLSSIKRSLNVAKHSRSCGGKFLQINQTKRIITFGMLNLYGIRLNENILV